MDILTIESRDDLAGVLRDATTAVAEADEIGSVAAVEPAAALEAVDVGGWDVVVLAQASGDGAATDLCEAILDRDAKLPVIFVADESEAETAIEATRLGAYDFLTRPLDVEQLLETVRRAAKTRRMMRRPVVLTTDDSISGEDVRLVGRGPEMIEVFKAIGRVASQDVTVLVRGESGTGKELVARALYHHSDRVGRPFVAVNCAALPDTLLESELFGHEKGAFTGAERRRIGKFEQCHGGTIFLDEVGDMSPNAQAKVLRLLQEQKFERVGGTETIATDVRVITATHRDLEQMVEEGEFRADLLYRLNEVSIHLPPLRERSEDDFEMLVRYFLTKASKSLGDAEVTGLSKGALSFLKDYHWPGNIRELQNVIRQAVLNASGPVVVGEFLPDELVDEVRRLRARGESDGEDDRGSAGPALLRADFDGGEVDPIDDVDLSAFVERRLRADSIDLYAEAVEFAEKVMLTRVLQETEGNQSAAAKILGITRGKVRDRVAKFGIDLSRQVTVDAGGA